MQHRPVEFSVRELVKQVAAGTIALPEFQRRFIWEPTRVVDLLDSVSNGWPIGSLLLLEGPQPFEIRPIEQGPPVHPEQVRYYLLDGQQRVTSLYHALTDTSDIVYYIDLAPTEDDYPPPFRWARRARGIPASRRSTSHHVAHLLNERYFSDLLSELPSAEAMRIRRIREERLGYFLEDRYRVPATLMNDDINLEALTRIFETLNRTGVRLDAFDLMVAVLYPHDFHLRDAWEGSLVDHPILEEMEASGLELLKLIALWQRVLDRRHPRRPASRNVTGVRQGDVLNIPPSFVSTNWERAASSYGEALKFLRLSAGVSGPDSTPSEAMVLTLAYALAEGRDRGEIERWYWQSIASQRYAQGANTQVIADVDRLPALDDPDSVALSLQSGLGDFARRNRILRLGLRGFLLRRRALDPVTGSALDPKSMAEASVLRLIGEGELGLPTDARVADLLFCNHETRGILRDAKYLGLERFSAEGLASQGFAPDLLRQLDEGSAWREDRVRRISLWMESVL